jgi:hypothetical protein
MTPHALTPPLDAKQVRAVALRGQLLAARRRAADAGASTRMGALLSNQAAQLERELRDLEQNPSSAQPI